MKNKSLIITLTAATLLVACGKKEEKKPAPKQPDIETFTAQKEMLGTDIRLPAELTGFQVVDIYAKVNSFVKELKVDIGTRVKKGQLLIVLEAPEISAQLSAAKSKLKAQEANYIASNGTYNRVLETSKVEGTISKNDLDLAKARKDADFAQFEAAKASYNEVQNIQNYLMIRAPFDGVVAARNVNPGAYVGPGSTVPLFTIQEQNKLRLSVYVPEKYTGYLKNGDDVAFNVKSLPGADFKAKVARLSGALDAKLRAERVEMDVVNKDGRLLPGLIAEVVLPLQARDSVVVVPATALVASTEGLFVIGVEDNKTKRIKVQRGREADQKIEVYGNIPQNATLVKVASEEIKDGTTVKN